MTRPTSDRSASIASLKEKMARDPFSRAFLQLAEEYRKAGEFEEAVRVCKEGLARHPGYHTARIALGRTYLEAGELENARASLAEVVELAPENHLAGKLLAEVQRRLGDAAGAIATYRAILQHYPGDREVRMLLEDLLQAGGPGDAAGPGGAEPDLDYRPEDLGGPAPPGARLPERGAAEPALEPPPAPPAPAAGVAPLAAAERPSPAEREGLPGAVDEDEPDALQTNTLAELYLRQGLVDRAIEVYRSMLRVDPGNGRARRRLEELSSRRVVAPGAPSTAADAPRAGRPPDAGVGRPDSPAGPPWPRTAGRAGPGPAKVERLERWLDAVLRRSDRREGVRAP
ncbi:MAG: tetratricopeptide repeat protein [Acidobacteriota bacterium]